MDERRKALEAYAKQVQQGNPLADDFINEVRKNEKTDKWNIERLTANRALGARNLAEESLANEVLKNTGLKIPGDNAPRLKKEDFLMRLMKERYPELDTDISMGLMMDHTTPEGLYSPAANSILLKNNPSILDNTAGALHETAHQYDDNILKFDGTDDVSTKNLKTSAPAKKLLTDIDPAEAYEIMAKGHHANIPKLREGSFGLGALKSMLKTGTFKALPIVGPALGAAAAFSSGDAAAAVPVLNEAEDVGMSAADERAMLNEHDARVNYDNSPAKKDLRREALTKLKGMY